MKGGDFFGNVRKRVDSFTMPSIQMPTFKIPFVEKENEIEELLLPERELSMYNRLRNNDQFRSGLGFQKIHNLNSKKQYFYEQSSPNHMNQENYTFEVVNQQNGQKILKKTTVRKNFKNMNNVTSSEFILNGPNQRMMTKILHNILNHVFNILFHFEISNVNQEMFVTRYFVDLLNELSTKPDFSIEVPGIGGLTEVKELKVNPVYQKIKQGKKDYFILHFKQGLTNQWKGPIFFCIKVKKSRDDLYKLVKVNMQTQMSPNGSPFFSILDS